MARIHMPVDEATLEGSGGFEVRGGGLAGGRGLATLQLAGRGLLVDRGFAQWLHRQRVNFECAAVALCGGQACGRRRVGVSKKRNGIRRRSSFYKTLARREKVGATVPPLPPQQYYANSTPILRAAGLHVICPVNASRSACIINWRRSASLRIVAPPFCCLGLRGSRHQTVISKSSTKHFWSACHCDCPRAQSSTMATSSCARKPELVQRFH